MENLFDDMQKRWSSQKAPIHLQQQTQSGRLMEKLRKMDRRLKAENRLLSILFPATTLVLIGMLLLLPRQAFHFYIGMGGIVCLIVVYLKLFVQRNFHPAGELEQDSKTFVRSTLEKLWYNKKVTRVYMPWYAIGLIGCVVMTINAVFLYTDVPLVFVWGLPLVVGIILGMTFWAGIRSKLAEDQRLIDPLIERLTSLSEQLDRQ